MRTLRLMLVDSRRGHRRTLRGCGCHRHQAIQRQVPGHALLLLLLLMRLVYRIERPLAPHSDCWQCRQWDSAVHSTCRVWMLLLLLLEEVVVVVLVVQLLLWRRTLQHVRKVVRLRALLTGMVLVILLWLDIGGTQRLVFLVQCVHELAQLLVVLKIRLQSLKHPHKRLLGQDGASLKLGRRAATDGRRQAWEQCDVGAGCLRRGGCI